MKLFGAALMLGVALAAAEATAQAPATPAPPPVDEATMTALMQSGDAVYRRECAVCHGNAGQGGAGQQLAGYSLLVNTTSVLNQILLGGSYMPPFASGLGNADIAAVATYIRNSFGNSYGAVTEAEVAALR